MNMGPRTWYQVPPRELRYPEVRPLPEKSHLTNTEVLDKSQQFYYTAIFQEFKIVFLKQHCRRFSIKGLFQDPHLQYGLPPMGQPGMKRSAEGAGLDMMEPPSSDEDSSEQKPQIHSPHHDQYEDHEG